VGQGGASGGGRTDEPREDAAENVAVRGEAEHGGGIHRKQGKARSGECRRAPNGLFLRIVDSHIELSSPALGTWRSPLWLQADRKVGGFKRSQNKLSERTGRTKELLRLGESESTGKRSRSVEMFCDLWKSTKEFLRWNRFELLAQILGAAKENA
jgi:hypothetical protein